MVMPDTGPGVAAQRSSRTQEGREAGTRAAARRPQPPDADNLIAIPAACLAGRPEEEIEVLPGVPGA